MEEKKLYTYLGIDVAKATLRVQTPKANFEINNDIDGITLILKECAKFNAPLVVFEATGGYGQYHRVLHSGVPSGDHLAQPQHSLRVGRLGTLRQ